MGFETIYLFSNFAVNLSSQTDIQVLMHFPLLSTGIKQNFFLYIHFNILSSSFNIIALKELQEVN